MIQLIKFSLTYNLSTKLDITGLKLTTESENQKTYKILSLKNLHICDIYERTSKKSG